MSTPNPMPTLDAVRADAGWFVHQIDPVLRRALFVRLGEDEIRSASFLDDRIGPGGRPSFWMPLDTLPAPADGSVPDLIFHVGHSGSTLLSRLLDLAPQVLGLREPRVLRDLAALEAEARPADAWLAPESRDAAFARALALLARPFRQGQRTIVKATSTCNNLIAPLLSLRPDARIVLMHVPLEAYLATILKSPAVTHDVLLGAPARLRALRRKTGEDVVPPLHALAPAEAIALGWAADRACFVEAMAIAAPQATVVDVDFEVLLQDVTGELSRITSALALGAIEGSPDTVLRGYSKQPGHAYSPADRAHDLALSRRMFGGDIARGLRAVEALLARGGLPDAVAAALR